MNLLKTVQRFSISKRCSQIGQCTDVTKFSSCFGIFVEISIYYCQFNMLVSLFQFPVDQNQCQIEFQLTEAFACRTKSEFEHRNSPNKVHNITFQNDRVFIGVYFYTTTNSSEVAFLSLELLLMVNLSLMSKHQSKCSLFLIFCRTTNAQQAQ